MSGAKENAAKVAAKAGVESVEDVIKQPLNLIFTGLGITFAPHAYLGGLFLALAGASIASSFNEKQDRKGFWIVMLTAIFVSHLAAMVAGNFWPSVAPQFVMAAAGFASRFIVKIAIRSLGIVEERSDKVADKIVDKFLPDDKDV